MNRQKIEDAILKKYQESQSQLDEQFVRNALRRIVSDTSLISLAQTLGIDTDKILSEKVPS